MPRLGQKKLLAQYTTKKDVDGFVEYELSPNNLNSGQLNRVKKAISRGTQIDNKAKLKALREEAEKEAE